jgi:hypothetical protein
MKKNYQKYVPQLKEIDRKIWAHKIPNQIRM